MSLYVICGMIHKHLSILQKTNTGYLVFSIIFTQFEVLIKLVNGYILSQGTHIVIIGIRHDIITGRNGIHNEDYDVAGARITTTVPLYVLC